LAVPVPHHPTIERRTHTGFAILAALMPFGWLVFSYRFYGDIFPTSFYLKGTSISLKQIALNAIYTIYFSIMSGLAVAASSWPLTRLRHIKRRLSKDWWLVFGIASFILYALDASAVHMMFGYRLFVPFLPVFAFIVVVAGPPPLRMWRVAMLAAIQILVTGHMFAYAINATPASLMRSVGLRNQLSRLGFENSGLSVREYEWASIRVWAAIADDAARDWSSRPVVSSSRPPRISTFVDGLVPYRFRGADAYDSLLAYRHRCARKIRDSVD
jgi:arabinofuranosyltransferase